VGLAAAAWRGVGGAGAAGSNITNRGRGDLMGVELRENIPNVDF